MRGARRGATKRPRGGYFERAKFASSKFENEVLYGENARAKPRGPRRKGPIFATSKKGDLFFRQPIFSGQAFFLTVNAELPSVCANRPRGQIPAWRYTGVPTGKGGLGYRSLGDISRANCAEKRGDAPRKRAALNVEACLSRPRAAPGNTSPRRRPAYGPRTGPPSAARPARRGEARPARRGAPVRRQAAADRNGRSPDRPGPSGLGIVWASEAACLPFGIVATGVGGHT